MCQMTLSRAGALRHGDCATQQGHGHSCGNGQSGAEGTAVGSALVLRGKAHTLGGAA